MHKRGEGVVEQQHQHVLLHGCICHIREADIVYRGISCYIGTRSKLDPANLGGLDEALKVSVV